MGTSCLQKLPRDEPSGVRLSCNFLELHALPKTSWSLSQIVFRTPRQWTWKNAWTAPREPVPGWRSWVGTKMVKTSVYVDHLSLRGFKKKGTIWSHDFEMALNGWWIFLEVLAPWSQLKPAGFRFLTTFEMLSCAEDGPLMSAFFSRLRCSRRPSAEEIGHE